MKILVTGTEGYLGCLLAPELLRRRATTCVGVDTGYYKHGWLYNGVDRDRRSTLAKDIRHVDRRRPRGRRRRRAHGRAVQRPDRRPRSATSPTTINHQGSVRLARAGEAGRRRAVRLHVLVQRLRRRRRRRRRDVARSTRRPPTPSARRWSSATSRALADDDFSPTFLRNATAFGASPRHALRHRAEQPLRPGLDHQRDRDDQRRHARGARWCTRSTSRKAIRVRARGAARGRAQRGLQRRQQRAELPGARDRRDRRRRVPRLRADLRRRRRPTTAATGWTSTRSASQLPGFTLRLGRRARRRAAARGLRVDRPRRRETFTGRGHTRLKQLEYLMRTEQVDAELFWTADRMISSPTTADRGRRPSSSSSARSDDRGFFARTFCRDGVRRRTASSRRSRSATSRYNHKAGTLRGMHYQLAAGRRDQARALHARRDRTT